MKNLAVFAFALAPLLSACSSNDHSSMPMPNEDAAMDMGDMDMGTADTATASDTGGSDAGEMAPPTITAVAKMSGALHVQWTNNTTTCDSIEGERKMDSAAYKVIFTVPGTVNNKMDLEATQDMTYTYRLRCKMGTAYSAYSNEMGNNPKK